MNTRSHRFSGDKAYKIMFYILLGIIAAIVLVTLVGFVVKLLWNVTIAEIFSLSAISFWQAIGLLILAKLFFGFGGGSSTGKRFRRKAHQAKNGDLPSRKDQSFRDYWQRHGRAAFDDYLAAQQHADQTKDLPPE